MTKSFIVYFYSDHSVELGYHPYEEINTDDMWDVIKSIHDKGFNVMVKSHTDEDKGIDINNIFIDKGVSSFKQR